MEKTLTLGGKAAQAGYGGSLVNFDGVKPLFRTIPPERVGLNGEYDHSGLAKRVKLAFNRAFGSTQIANLKVAQRGRVVILKGKVKNCQVLDRLTQVAMQVKGAADIETQSVRIESP
ncbi:MAG: BON domain-containing protein [Cyanothece sp. SIO1E1]|nr:BON domain-containing protein [Cyanothece sp. SIO1E1]